MSQAKLDLRYTEKLLINYLTIKVHFEFKGKKFKQQLC